MYFDDHHSPHFHALYGDVEAIVSIDPFDVVEGRLPPRALGLVAEWAALHQKELQAAWARAKAMQPPGRIEPLP
jgi:hypothetical protein